MAWITSHSEAFTDAVNAALRGTDYTCEIEGTGGGCAVHKISRPGSEFYAYLSDGDAAPVGHAYGDDDEPDDVYRSSILGFLYSADESHPADLWDGREFLSISDVRPADVTRYALEAACASVAALEELRRTIPGTAPVDFIAGEPMVSTAIALEDIATGDITPGTARTIAGWWASPGSVGSVLAALSQSLPVIPADVLADIDATIAQDRPGTADRAGLEALRSFVTKRA